jgi:hypothetical protein
MDEMFHVSSLENSNGWRLLQKTDSTDAQPSTDVAAPASGLCLILVNHAPWAEMESYRFW